MTTVKRRADGTISCCTFNSGYHLKGGADLGIWEGRSEFALLSLNFVYGRIKSLSTANVNRTSQLRAAPLQQVLLMGSASNERRTQLHVKRSRRNTGAEPGKAPQDASKHHNGGKRQSGGHRLQLVFTPEVRSLLDRLKDASEAESYGELVRRALRALEHFHPFEGGRKSNVIPLPTAVAPKPVGCSERLQIVLSERSMRRLEALKFRMKQETGGGSYSEVIRQALMVFAQLNRDLGWLGNDESNDHRKEVVDDHVPSSCAAPAGDQTDRVVCLV